MVPVKLSSGRVHTVLNAGAASANSSWLGGFAYDSTGRLQLDTAAVASAVFRNGVACKPSGVVFVTTADPGATSSANGGLRVSATGALHVHVTDPVVGAVGGIPVTAKGAVAVSTVT